jgi:hypothetical protein
MLKFQSRIKKQTVLKNAILKKIEFLNSNGEEHSQTQHQLAAPIWVIS